MSYNCFSSVVIEAKVSADEKIKRNSENYDLNYMKVEALICNWFQIVLNKKLKQNRASSNCFS